VGQEAAERVTGADSEVQIHPTAVVDPTAAIGAGTRLWAHVCVLADVVIGADCRIGHAAFVDRGVRVGDRVIIHNKASVYRPVTIGNDVFVGPHVVFVNDPDPRSDLTRSLGSTTWHVSDGTTIGANATIMSDVNLAEHCLVGAGAVVTRSTVPFGIYVGVPARLVGYRCTCRKRYSLKPGLPQTCPHCSRTFSQP
jgi:UDP-2-acetamido-3-amino-2,3-dideoxy-glucuronate N-acetyltransferase